MIPPRSGRRSRQSWERWAPRLEAAIAQSYDGFSPGWQARLLRLRDFAWDTSGRRWLLAGLFLATLALIAARTARGHGDLVVCIAYPDDLRGSFTVALSRRRPRRTRRSPAEREAAKAKVSSRTEHHLVSRETQFRGVVPGRYWVSVDGELHGSGSDGALEEPYECQSVHVGSRDTCRLEFDLKPRNCPVEIRVVWDGQPVSQCAVSVVGRPDTFRILRGQSARIGLPLGRHLVALGSGDRVAEREIVVDSYATLTVEVDLGRAEGVLFKGCPPAVTPYLQGDVQTSARALAREGQDKLSNFLLARMHASQGNKSRAAEHFEYAEYFADAARLREELSEWSRAAALFQRAGEPCVGRDVQPRGRPAARGQGLRGGGRLRARPRLLPRGGRDRACDRRARAQRRPFQAAVLARENDDRGRAIKLLQQVLPDDPNYAEACLLLADALETEGHCDLAARKLEERIERDPRGRATRDLRGRLADLLERAGDTPRALDVLEKLRQEEPTFPTSGPASTLCASGSRRRATRA